MPPAISGLRAGAPYRSPQTPRAPQPNRGLPPAPPPPGVPGLLQRPAPAPLREPSGTGCPTRGCCVGRGRPSCARKRASAARKLLETQRRPARPVTWGVDWGPCCCRGCREMEAEPAILGLHQNNVIPRWDLGDSGRFHSSVTHSPTNKPPSPWPLCGLPTDRLGDSEKIATSRAHRLPSGPKSSPFFRSLLQPHPQKRPPNFPE